MTHGLNLTLPIKQDPETLAKLEHLKEVFASEIQPKIAEALRASELVHFARVNVIYDSYIQVITAYDGSHQEYTEFFRRALKPIFDLIFSLADGDIDVDDPAAFFAFAKKQNIRSLGLATDGSLDMDGEPAGWLFSAYDHKPVKELLPKIQGS